MATPGSFTGADLVSCGGGGWVRFWGTTKASLLAEFVAHPHAGNVIATTDPEDQYLVTGKLDGLRLTNCVAFSYWYKEHNCQFLFTQVLGVFFVMFRDTCICIKYNLDSTNIAKMYLGNLNLTK